MRANIPESPGEKSNITVEKKRQKSKNEETKHQNSPQGKKEAVDGNDTKRVPNDESSFVSPVVQKTSPLHSHKPSKKEPNIVRKVNNKSRSSTPPQISSSEEAENSTPQYKADSDDFVLEQGANEFVQPGNPITTSHLDSTPNRQSSGALNSTPPRHSTTIKKPRTSNSAATHDPTINRPPVPIRRSTKKEKSASLKVNLNRPLSPAGTHPTETSTISMMNNELPKTTKNTDEDSSDTAENSRQDPLMLYRRQPYSPSTTKKVKSTNRKKKKVKPKSKSHRTTPLTSSAPQKSKTKLTEFDLKATELDDMNYAVEELLNENASLKREIEKHRTAKKPKKIPENHGNCDSSKIISRQKRSLIKKKEETKRERRKYEKTKKKLEEKRQQCRSLLFATAYANATGRYRDISFYDQIKIEKENKVLTDEIGGLQRELSATLNVLEKTEKERNLCRSHIKQYISAVQILTEQKEELQEKNNALKQKLQDMIEKEKYSFDQNQKLLDKKDDLIRSLETRVSCNVPKLSDNESEYSDNENSSLDLEHELHVADDLWAETMEDLAILDDTIENVKANQEKYRSDRKFEELDIEILREKKLIEIQSDLENKLKDINEEKKFVIQLSNRSKPTKQRNSFNDSEDYSNPVPLNESSKKRVSGFKLPSYSANQDFSSRMKEVEEFISEYRKNKQEEKNVKVNQTRSQPLTSLSEMSQSSKFDVHSNISKGSSVYNEDDKINMDQKSSNVTPLDHPILSNSKSISRNPQNKDILEEYDDDSDEVSTAIAPVSQLHSIGTRSLFTTLPQSPKIVRTDKNIDKNGNTRLQTVPQLKSIGDISPNEEEFPTKSLILPNGRVRIPGAFNKTKSLSLETMLNELQHLYQPPKNKS